MNGKYRFFIEFAYDGSNYHGWQRQPQAITIQQKLQEGLSMLLRGEVILTGAGRTDAGVHALQMFAHFDWHSSQLMEELVYRLNRWLPYDISVFEIFQVAENAHTRFNAIARSYEYHFHLRPDPFQHNRSYVLHRLPDFKLMQNAADLMMKHTDFQCFSRSNTDVKTYICDLMRAEFEFQEHHVIFHIKANRFLRNMVRAVVGTLLEVGYGKVSLDQFEEIIASKNRSNAGASAPAFGLYLSQVHYLDKTFENEKSNLL
jgi:tRNA pseudouridine38-40 synthase